MQDCTARSCARSLRPRGPPGLQDQRETEADSVAWIVGQVVGVDFTEATAIYLGGWAGSGDKQKDVLTAAAEAVHRAANYMIGVLAPEQA